MIQLASSRRAQTPNYSRQAARPGSSGVTIATLGVSSSTLPGPRFLPGRSRGERLIAAGRFGLALFAALAVRVDPPPSHALLASAVTAAYLFYSIPLLFVVRSGRLPHAWVGHMTHATDLAVATILTAATAGASSPFFVLLIFAMLCAAVRWGSGAVIRTGAFTIAVFLVVSVMPYYGAEDAFALSRFLIRTSFLAVVVVLLTALAEHHGRLEREIASLAEWPRPAGAGYQAIAESIVSRAAAVLGAPRVALVIAREGRREAACVLWSHGTTSHRRLESAILDVHPGLAGRTFMATDLATAAPAAVKRVGAGAEPVAATDVPAAILEEFAPETLIAAPIESDTWRGRLLVFDKRSPAVGDLELAQIVARLASAQIAFAAMQDRLRDAAVVDERVRLSRDLHDGILQSLTAAQFQLETSVRRIHADPDGVAARLRDVQLMIEAEQRELRALIRDLRPSPGAPDHEPALADRLGELRSRIERHWGLQVTIDVPPGIESLAGPVARTVYWIVHEAVVNAARHAHGTRVSVWIRRRSPAVAIVVSDNGRGFPFTGRLTLTDVQARGIGPLTLTERVAALDGSLAVESTESGSRIEVELPAEAREDAWPSGF